MKWLVRIVIFGCLILWAAFLCGCVAIDGVPLDGQVYRCTVDDEVVEKCGPWDDWEVPAYELLEEHPNARVDCRGTRRACDL